MIKTVDIAWAAGFLEGEGCFAAAGGKYPSNALTASQSEPEQLHKLSSLFGGRVRQRPRHTTSKLSKKPMWEWGVYGPRAAGVMMTIYKFMSEHRKRQILVTLNKWKTQKRRHWKLIEERVVADRKSGLTQQSIAHRYGMPEGTVYYMLKRAGLTKTWEERYPR